MKLALTPRNEMSKPTQHVRVFDSARRPNVAPGRGSSQWSSPREGKYKEIEVGLRVECAEDVKEGNDNDCACDIACQM